MVRTSVRRNKPPVALNKNVVYRPGSFCIVLAPEDRLSFANFFSILMNVEKRMKGTKKQSSGPTGEDSSSINRIKIKGSQISGPLVFKIVILDFINVVKFLNVLTYYLNMNHREVIFLR